MTFSMPNRAQERVTAGILTLLYTVLPSRSHCDWRLLLENRLANQQKNTALVYPDGFVHLSTWIERAGCLYGGHSFVALDQAARLAQNGFEAYAFTLLRKERWWIYEVALLWPA